MKFNREISLGTVLQIVAYLVMVIVFAVEMRSQISITRAEMILQFKAAQADIVRLERSVGALTWRMDAHLEGRSLLFNPKKGESK
jgi:hypothetical protein